MEKVAPSKGVTVHFTDDKGLYAERLEKFTRGEYDIITLPINSYLEHGAKHQFPGVIVAAVGSQTEVWMDGGIRSGQDVLKAWALGARGTMIGRAMVYGLGAMGEAGVTKALQIIHKELDVTMAFCGHTNIANVDSGILLPGTY